MREEINSTILIKAGALTTSSSVTAKMVIFNDPTYIYLAIIGAILSLVGIIHEFYHLDEKFTIGRIATDLIKALILGAILTPMFFMLYLQVGSELIEYLIGLRGLDGIYNSFWFLLSLLTSWYSPLIWENIINIIIKKRGENDK